MKIKLTENQLALWTGQRLNDSSPLNNTAYTYDITGVIDVVIFKKVFQELINSTDAFRIIFGEEGGNPYQTVRSEVNYELEVVDFSMEPDSIQHWITQRSLLLFDLSTCIFDSVLIKAADNRYIWFLNMHHLVTDAISFVEVFKRTALLYKNLSEGLSTETEKWPQFMDELEKAAELAESEEYQKAKTYWSHKISGLTEPPVLYGNRNNGTTTQAKRISVKLGTERSDKLRKLAQQPAIRSWTTHLSLFNIISSVLFIYLNRVGNQRKISIGAPFHGRTSKTAMNTVGYFIKILPLVIDFQEDDTFETVLQRNKLEINEYLRYSPAGALNFEISKSFNVVFNYINVAFPDFNGLKTTVNWIHPDHMERNHQMRCHVLDFNSTGELELLIDLNTGVFNEALMKKVPRHFLKLFDALLENIQYPILEPSLVDEKEAIGITHKNSATEVDFSTSIIGHFQETVALFPDSVALHYKAESYSYQNLNERVNELARFLQKRNLKKGSKVCIHMHRSPDYIISVLAVLKIGCAFIPIPSDYPSHRTKYIISDSDSTLVLTTSALKENIGFLSIPVLALDRNQQEIRQMEATNLPTDLDQNDLAYILYTSGSTGQPKGVLISHGALGNYLLWAAEYYKTDEHFIFPLFTSIGFDLTITATFLPLVTGGQLVIYKESVGGPDVSLMEVLEENIVNSIKLTPSHLALIQGKENTFSSLRTMIVGGEDFKTKIAKSTQDSFEKRLRIFNEYGPTEATIGCITTMFNPKIHQDASVPIGLPITNTQVYVLDDYMNLVPQGVTGMLFIAGAGLSYGYQNLPELTAAKFVDNPFATPGKLYQTGDLARMKEDGNFEYLGRADEQIKLKGFRIELADIEANLLNLQEVNNSAVVLVEGEKTVPQNEVVNCIECGLPSNFPNTDFDVFGVCHLCTAFKGYKDKAQRYFKSKAELKKILLSNQGKNPNYDCISLLSGGKDSTYILAQLVNMGLKVLAFTLDNGYISEQAKANIDRIVKKLGVCHIYGKTTHMNKIFVDSLQRHQNVCNGCFKTIYTLSTKIALEQQIPFVVTGLSRGQFFETRLTEELFWDENVDVKTIDDTILAARKLYHQEEDAVKEHLDVSMFDYEDTFQKVQFVDFYRYSDVSLEEMLLFLKEKVDWVRPTDTGRSTNCLINQVGIYVHKKQKGYSNYSFPYSWDVRMGHKTRRETLEEINEVIDEKKVKRIMNEIGYQETGESESSQKRLVAYYTGKQKISSLELVNHLRKELPEYMIPTYFKYVEELPLTSNGKVDKSALKALNTSQLEMDTPYVAPNGEIEVLLADIWKEVLSLKQVGIQDDFIALGGHSLAAIRITARINEEVEMKFPLNKIFEMPTIAQYAKYIEDTIVSILGEEK